MDIKVARSFYTVLSIALGMNELLSHVVPRDEGVLSMISVCCWKVPKDAAIV
jgi:hypothetical protein